RVMDLDESTLIAALRRLIAVHLLVEERGEAGTSFVFRHALVRNAIYDRLLEPERRRLHRRIAHVLATETGAWPAATDSELGPPFYVAGEWEQAQAYCQRAGEQAQALYTPQAAIEHFSRALIAAERTHASRTEIRLLRGEAYEWIGDLERAGRDYATALTEARAAGDRAAEWQALMRFSAVQSGGAYMPGLPYVEEALALARAMDDPAATAHSLNRLGYFAIFADQPFDAERYHGQALTIFRSLGDERGIAETLERLGYARFFGADFVGGARDLQEALARYTTLDDRRGMVFCLVGLSERSATLWTDWMVSATPRVVDAIPEGERALRLARESGWRLGEAYSLSFLANCIGAAGEYARALQWARESLAIAEEIGHDAQQFLAHAALSYLSLDLLALPLATRHLDAALALAQRLGSRHYLEGTIAVIVRMHLAGNAVAQAAAALHEHFPSDFPLQTFQQRQLWLAKAELALAEGDATRALTIADQLIETAPNIAALVGRGIPRIDRVRGEALMALGQHARAEETFRTAQETAREQGARPLLWRLHCSLGALYHKTRRQSLATREFAAAQQIIEELAATVPDDHTRGTFLRNAFAIIPRAYLIAARRVAKEQYGGLTVREREVVTSIASGKTNREIAEALFVTEKTIELHVSNSLRKRGFRSRVELAAWAVSSGLTGADADEQAATH
ncbi:MAG: helix-turn-helix transcriptional regulator, partial [Terriglobales bacterium]